MHLSVKGRQLDVGDALRSHVADNLTSVVSKFFGRPIEANVVFSRDAHLFKADISVHVGRGIMVQTNGEADEPYPAFDTACDKIAKRLRRYKERLKRHHNNAETAPEPVHAKKYILQAEPEDHHDGHAAVTDGHQPVVIAEMTMPIETLTTGEAVMRMELADLPAMMFRNSAHGGLNMIYRRVDGNVGWVDPKGSGGVDA